MATARNKRNGRTRKQNRTSPAKSRRIPKRKARSAPLNAAHAATRTQDLSRDSQRVLGKTVSSGLGAIGLVSRRTKALLDLPTQIARCRSPFEVWSVQARFIREGFSDYADEVTTFLRGPRGRDAPDV